MAELESFESWVRQERDDLMRFAVLVAASRPDAAAVLGEVLAGLRREFHSMSERGDPESQARRGIVAGLQHRAAVVDPTTGQASGAAPRTPDAGLAPDPVDQRLASAWRAWQERPPGVRAAVALHLHDGLSIRETARVLDLAEATVRSHVQLTLMAVAGVATHKGRATETSAHAEPVLRDLLALMAAAPLPVVEVPRASPRPGLVLAALATVCALVAVALLGADPLGWNAERTSPAPSRSSPVSLRPLPSSLATAVTTVDPLPPPMPGWRWVSTRDTAVQVPADWRATRRSTDWGWLELSADGRTCQEEAIEVLACVSAAPSPMLVLLEWRPAAPQPEPPPGRVITRQLGAAWLVAGAPPDSDTTLPERILATAVVVTRDLLGCPVRHHAAARDMGFFRPDPAWDVSRGEIAPWVTLCRYHKDDNDGRSTLLSSVRYEGQRAVDLVTALRAAPPEGRRCEPLARGVRVIVLRLETPTGPRELYAYPNGCDDNHLDDGTSRREITPAVCLLLGLPVGESATCGG